MQLSCLWQFNPSDPMRMLIEKHWKQEAEGEINIVMRRRRKADFDRQGNSHEDETRVWHDSDGNEAHDRKKRF